MTRIRVPGTSANLGPGFDALGLALNIYNWYEVEEAHGAASSRVEGCPPELSGEDNLFLAAYRRGLEALGLSYLPLSLRIEARIPIARGLGSSAACIVGGLLAASVLGGRRQGRAELPGQAGAFSKAELLDLAAGLEGHPDNVAPAIYGGFRASCWDGRRASSLGRPLGGPGGLDFYALIPPFPLETRLARAALPKEVAFADAVFNLGRASLATASFMSRDWSCLAGALEDRLHQDWRAPLIPGYREVVAASKAAGAAGVYLSGAGPTVMVLGIPGEARAAGSLKARLEEAAAAREPRAWTCMALEADDMGAMVEE
jgi:homoserine kinase